MEAEPRCEQLTRELSKLGSIVADYHATCPSATVNNPFIDELERQMREKADELEALNAAPRSRARLYGLRYWFLLASAAISVALVTFIACQLPLMETSFAALSWVASVIVTVIAFRSDLK